MLEWDWKNIQRSSSIDSNVSVEIFIVCCRRGIETRFYCSVTLEMLLSILIQRIVDADIICIDLIRALCF